MREAVSTVLELRAPGPDGLSRLMTWSFALHVGAAAAVFGWQALLPHLTPDSKVMTISLSGSSGPATGGQTALGGRQIDEVKPEPKRPEPIPAVASKPEEMTVSTKPITKPPPVRRETPAPTSSVVTPASTGRQVTTGSSVVENGARGLGAGLAQGGGAAQMANIDPAFTFCCSDYLSAMSQAITKAVEWKQNGHGTVVIQFVVMSDGSIPAGTIKVDKGSGNTVLDFEAQRAVSTTRLPPLPPAYTEKSLKVFVTIPF